MPVDCPAALRLSAPPGHAAGIDARASRRPRTRGVRDARPRSKPARDARRGHPPTSSCWRPPSAPGATARGTPPRCPCGRSSTTSPSPGAPRRRAMFAPGCGVLHAAGWLERSRRHGVATWELTSAGRRRLRTGAPRGQRPDAARVSAAPRVARRAHGRRAGDRALPRERCASAWSGPRCCSTPRSRPTPTPGSSSPRRCSAPAGAWARRATACTSGSSRTTRRADVDDRLDPHRRATRPGRARASPRPARGEAQHPPVGRRVPEHDPLLGSPARWRADIQPGQTRPPESARGRPVPVPSPRHGSRSGRSRCTDAA